MLFDEGQNRLFDNWKEGVLYHLVIRGANHYDFTDINLVTLLTKLLGAAGPLGSGSLGPRRSPEVVNSYTVALFNQSLKDTAEPLLAGPSPDFPEVRYERYPPR